MLHLDHVEMYMTNTFQLTPKLGRVCLELTMALHHTLTYIDHLSSKNKSSIFVFKKNDYTFYR